MPRPASAPVGCVHHIPTVGIARLDVIFFEGYLDPPPQLAADAILRSRPGLHQQHVIHFTATYLLDPGRFRFGDDHFRELGIVGHFLANFLQQLDHLIAVGAIGHGDMHRQLRPVAREVGHNVDLPIGYGMQASVVVAQYGAAQGHGLNRSLHAPNLNGVADVVLVLHQDEEAVDEVVDQSLRSKPYGQAGDTGTGEQRPHVDAQQRQDLQRRQEHDDEYSDAVDDARQGPKLLCPEGGRQSFTVAEFGQVPRCDLEQPAENERNDQNADDARHLVAHEVEGIVAPGTEHLEDPVGKHQQGLQRL